MKERQMRSVCSRGRDCHPWGAKVHERGARVAGKRALLPGPLGAPLAVPSASPRRPQPPNSLLSVLEPLLRLSSVPPPCPPLPLSAPRPLLSLLVHLQQQTVGTETDPMSPKMRPAASTSAHWPRRLACSRPGNRARERPRAGDGGTLPGSQNPVPRGLTRVLNAATPVALPAALPADRCRQQGAPARAGCARRLPPASLSSAERRCWQNRSPGHHGDPGPSGAAGAP